RTARPAVARPVTPRWRPPHRRGPEGRRTESLLFAPSPSNYSAPLSSDAPLRLQLRRLADPAAADPKLSSFKPPAHRSVSARFTGDRHASTASDVGGTRRDVSLRWHPVAHARCTRGGRGTAVTAERQGVLAARERPVGGGRDVPVGEFP